MLGMDIMGSLQKAAHTTTNTFVCVDYFSDWVEMFSMGKASAQTIAIILRKEIPNDDFWRHFVTICSWVLISVISYARLDDYILQWYFVEKQSFEIMNY